jgi:hypothetical protein
MREGTGGDVDSGKFGGGGRECAWVFCLSISETGGDRKKKKCLRKIRGIWVLSEGRKKEYKKRKKRKGLSENPQIDFSTA